MLHFPHTRERQNDTLTRSAHVSLALTSILILLLFWTTWSRNIFDAYGLAPHGYCFLWNTHLVILHVTSDSLIGLAYVFISGMLIYFVRTIYHDLPFRWIFVAFGAFIIACGFTHFLDIWTLWYATYWLSGTVKLITAIASLSTAITLPPLLPKVRVLIANAKASEERKRQLENAHAELEKLYEKAQELDQLKTQFFANVSHELRTPLTLILSSVSTLVAEQSHPDLEVIQRNASTLLKQINDLLDFAKMEAGKATISYSQVDIVQLLRESIDHFEALARKRRIAVIVDAPPSLLIEADLEKLQRIFLNMLSNAFKFTPPDGNIHCILNRERECAIFRIQDNGPGIPSELQQTIFEPFRQSGKNPRSFGGTGLGLAIVKEFVALHSGTIAVSESPGGGACFTIQLPLLAPSGISLADNTSAVSPRAEEIAQIPSEPWSELQGASPSADTQKIQGTGPRILIIEDNPEMSHSLVNLLSATYQTVTAFDGLEGLTKARELKPDLVLCDIMMPVMGGDQFVRELRTHPELNAMPVLILSARTDNQLRIRLLQEGAQDYLMKPFLPEELHARVANLLAMKQAREILQQELASQSQGIVSLTNEVIVRKHELEITNDQLTQMNTLQKDFVSLVSHEFRTTLTGIQGFSELLQSQELSVEEMKDYASDIYTDARRLSRMITDLLDLERMKAGKMSMHRESVDLNALLTEVVKKMRLTTSSKHVIHLQLDQALPPLNGDRDKLTQIILNLLSNAMKYSPAGGDILMRSTLEKDFAHISVQDHGIGISSEDVAKLFTAYSRIDTTNTRYVKGTGLGLAIVQQICEMHGGRVWVESAVGQGSTFHVALPLSGMPTVLL